jgi:uncharacterized protein YjbI with pentapeptide repeats
VRFLIEAGLIGIEESGESGVIEPIIDLRTADLSGADLNLADLSGANLSQANLKLVTLIRMNLRHADLSGADLHCANLAGANLSHANLSGADLSGAESWDNEQLARVRSLVGATLPDGRVMTEEAWEEFKKRYEQ